MPWVVTLFRGDMDILGLLALSLSIKMKCTYIYAGCCLPLASAQLLRWRAGLVFKAIGTIVSAHFAFPI